MAVPRLPSAAAAAFLRSQNGIYLSRFAPSGLFSAAHEQNSSLSFLNQVCRSRSLSVAPASQQSRWIFTATTKVSLGRACAIAGNVSTFAATIQARHSAALFFHYFPLRSFPPASNATRISSGIGGDSSPAFSSALRPIEGSHAFHRSVSMSRRTPDVTSSFLSFAPSRDCYDQQDESVSFYPASPTFPRTKKIAAGFSPVVFTRAASFLQGRSLCSSAIVPYAHMDTTARAVPPSAPSAATQVAPGNCSTGITTGVAILSAPSGPLKALHVAELAPFSCRRRVFCFLLLRGVLPADLAALPSECKSSNPSLAASSLNTRSPFRPSFATLGALAPAASVSLSTPSLVPLKRAAAAVSKDFLLTPFPVAITSFRSSMLAPTSLAWEMQSKRSLGARTRRQREEMERKAEQQRNSQLTGTQYSLLHSTPDSSQHPPTYSSHYQQVPPAGGPAGLSLGWQITIAFVSSIAFYFGFVMMMRLFGGHRVVAVHVDQYGRPVDPLTGQPRY